MNIGKFKLIKKIKEKKKKGFTLVELLAVIVILAVIMVITIPTVIGSMNNAKEKAEDVFVASIERSLNKFIENELVFGEYLFNENKNNLYVSQERDDFGFIKVKKSETEDLKISDLINMGYLTEDSITNPKDNSICDKDEMVNLYKNPYEGKYYYKVVFKCGEQFFSFNTLPQPEAPDLSTGLVPIKYNEGGKYWEITTEDDPDWYDYYEQKWANAASLKSTNPDDRKPGTKLILPTTSSTDTNVYAMFVWIPRFSYTIGCGSDFNGDNINECLGYKINKALDLKLEYTDYGQVTSVPGAIDIKFTSKDEVEDLVATKNILPTYQYNIDNINNRKPDNWYTHPAFWWDDNSNGQREAGEELSGIWVGKFETSGSKDDPTILPNVSSFAKKSLKVFSDSSKKFVSKQNLKGDSHIMKNSEWSAVAYLSQSIYGKYGNDSYSGLNKIIYKNDSTSYFTGKSYGDFSDSGSQYKNTGKGTCTYDDIVVRNDDIGACGAGASTTGTIYGIYDMVGGAYEYVMGNYNKKTSSSDGFSGNLPDEKYYNSFSISNPFVIKNLETIGFALSETIGWYEDKLSQQYLYSDSKSWMARGGYSYINAHGGIFKVNSSEGGGNSDYGFRVTLVNN